MKNVFITNYVDFDLDDAWKFIEKKGSIIPITKGRINIFNIDNLVRKIKEKLVEITEDDWVIISGNPVVSSLVCSLIIQKFGKMNLLLWDARNRNYVPRKVSQKETRIEEYDERNFNQ